MLTDLNHRRRQTIHVFPSISVKYTNDHENGTFRLFIEFLRYYMYNVTYDRAP